MRARSRSVFVAVALVFSAACGGQQPVGEPDPPPPQGWRVGVAEHLALWYHGLAYTAAAADADAVLPRFDPEYVDEITARKRQRGVFPTDLDERAAEFAGIFAGDDAYTGLEFVPLYFRSLDALMAGIALWDEAGGNPNRAGSAAGAQIVAFFSSIFPRPQQREVVVEWAALLAREHEAFYQAEWQARQPALEARAAAVQQEWDVLVPALATYLDYTQLERGEMFLVPALGVEGRTVTGGVTYPRIAVLEPSSIHPEDAVLAFVHELLYPLIGEVIREYVAPAEVRSIGEEALAERSAVRGGAILLERTSPGRVDDYQRLYLRATGRRVPAGDRERDRAFAEAFPLPDALEDGLVTAVETAVAGI